MREGKLTDIQRGHLRGEDAFYQLLERPLPGQFAFVKGAPPEKPGEKPREILPLTLEAMRRYDEFQEAAILVPDTVVLVRTEVAATPHPDREGRQLPAGALGAREPGRHAARLRGRRRERLLPDPARARPLGRVGRAEDPRSNRGRRGLPPDRQVLVVDDRVALADGRRGPRLPAARSSRSGRGRAEAAAPRARSAPRPAGRSSAGRADRSRPVPARRARRAPDCRRTCRGSPSRSAGACARSCRRRGSRRSSARCSGLLLRVRCSSRYSAIVLLSGRIRNPISRNASVSSRKKAENSPKKTGWTPAVSSIVSRETVASTELSEEPEAPETGPEPGSSAE